MNKCIYRNVDKNLGKVAILLGFTSELIHTNITIVNEYYACGHNIKNY